MVTRVLTAQSVDTLLDFAFAVATTGNFQRDELRELPLAPRLGLQGFLQWRFGQPCGRVRRLLELLERDLGATFWVAGVLNSSLSRRHGCVLRKFL